MQKPSAFPENDASLSQLCGMLRYDLNTKPFNGSPELHPDLHSPEVKLDVPASNTRLSARKRKFTEVERVSMNRFTNNRLINFDQPSFGGNYSNHVLPSSQSLWENKTKNGKCKQVSLPPSKLDLNHSYAPNSVLADEPEFILMSCLNCYLHVMVCDPNPKCPKCHKGEYLLDMYRHPGI